MAQHRITLLPGDGIGPEVTASVVSIIECAGVDVEWEKYFVGAEAVARFNDPLPPEVLESILRNKVALKGPVTTPIGTGFASINVRLRKTLDLYANLRPVKSFPNIITRFENVDRIVDNLCMQLVINPNQFDVLLLENLYGDIVSDLAAGLVGGLGVVAGANIGEAGAVFEAVHGSAPDIAGQNKANPLALLQSAVLMLYHIGASVPAKRVHDAIVKVLASGPEHRTRDIGGTGTTADFTTAMCETLRRGTRAGH